MGGSHLPDRQDGHSPVEVRDASASDAANARSVAVASSAAGVEGGRRAARSAGHSQKQAEEDSVRQADEARPDHAAEAASGAAATAANAARRA